MIDIALMALTFLLLYVLLLVVNYRAFTRYPDQLTERWFGRSILERKGPHWFIFVKASMFPAFLVTLLILTQFMPTCYSYLFFGILIGVVGLNLVYDYRQYKRVAKRPRKINQG